MKIIKFTFRTKLAHLLPAIALLAKHDGRSANKYIERLLIKQIGKSRDLLKKLDEESEHANQNK